MTHFDPVRQRFPRIPSYVIVDRKGFETHALGFATYNDPAVHFEWSADNRAELALGIFRQADSLEALAESIGIDATSMRASVERWNQLCREGRDADYGRQPWSMTELREPPFFAASVWPIVANTQGGPVHDARQRVMNPQGRPIEGLYAAGEMGSVFGHLYLSGGNLAECFVGGRIAGEEVARRAGPGRNSTSGRDGG